MRLKFFLIVSLLSISWTQPIAGTVQCRSYGRNLGECVAITRCPPLLTILLSPERTVQDLRMLQKLTCVTEISDLEKDPVVCCAKKDIQSLTDFLDKLDPPNITSTATKEGSTTTESTTTSKSTTLGTTTTTTTLRPDLLEVKFHLLPKLKECSSTISELESDKIIGGIEVNHGDHPWMARLGYRNKLTGKLEYYCGGSVISKRYILTAGHCTQGFDDSYSLSEVRLGEHVSSVQEDCRMSEFGRLCTVPVDYKVEKIITHPLHNTVTKHNDIALIRVTKDINFGNYFIKPVCLPFLKEYGITLPDDHENSDATVAGWGRTKWNVTKGGDKLLEVRIPLVSNSKCHLLYRRRVFITHKQMCAGGVKERDSCSGDSGGPLMIQIPVARGLKKQFQFGIVSFGQIQCGGLLPGVYTRVSEYLPWILENLEI